MVHREGCSTEDPGWPKRWGTWDVIWALLEVGIG